MNTAVWLAVRYFGSFKRFFNLSTSLAVLGMAIGVSSLVVSMAVFSGYNSTLEKTVQDAVGHILIMKRGAGDQTEMLDEIRQWVPGLQAETPFIYSEAILAHGGKNNRGPAAGGEAFNVKKRFKIDGRVGGGTFSLEMGEDGVPSVLIGKGIASKFELKVGDTFRIVVPLPTENQAAGFRPKLGRFRVAGVLNFGRYDFDSRYVIMDMAHVQQFVELGKRVNGFRLKIADPYRARGIAQDITTRSNNNYWARDWQEVNRNLFEAAKLEKAVLFVVLMVLVVAAAFNIANTLFVSVVQRYRDISVLKTLGASDRMIRNIFTAQGLIVGAVGALAGIALGLLLCRFAEWAQVRWELIPPDVYKLDHIDLDVQFLDLLAIVGTSLLICFVATLVPSRRGARITPVEGLRYE